VDGSSLSRSWYEGLIARGRGRGDVAQAAFKDALAYVEANLTQSPDDAQRITMMALIEAALGRKEEAIRDANRAVQLLPRSRDAIDGPILATNLAVIFAQVGEREPALAQLAQLVNSPNGPTPGLLRIEPEWDSLRGDPRFERMANPT
jgi:tetratricopeptide (TPR) repeat protein